MSRFKKTIAILLAILLILLLGTVMLNESRQASLPNQIYSYLPHLRLDGWLAQYYATGLFWLAATFIVLLLIFILVILFYPRTYTEVKLEDGHSGTLLLKKSAIEGFVKSIVVQNNLIQSPQVNTKIYKNKFKVSVSGRIQPRVGVIGKTVAIEHEIKKGLDTFFGIDKKVDYKVFVKQIQEQSHRARGRVE